MKNYLQGLIIEQIHRAGVLKRLIPFPLEHQEYASLAERCSIYIDECMGNLKELLELINEANDDETMRYIHRRFRLCVRNLEWIEHSGISVLKYSSTEVASLNKLLIKVHREINLPLNVPCVAGFSNQYFYYTTFTNVIFVPVAESEFLLHLPDLYHELGHYVVSKLHELKLKPLAEAYAQCIEEITQYYGTILARRLTETGPKELTQQTAIIHSQWKENWFEEFFCDMFAAYLIGMAYVWSHIHLTTKTSSDVYDFDPGSNTTHPSDESRFRAIISCLQKMGYTEECKTTTKTWNSLIFVKNKSPGAQYYEAYSNELIDKLAEIILTGMQSSKFNILSSEAYQKLPKNNIGVTLNESWKIFWLDPANYRKFEEELIENMRKVAS